MKRISFISMIFMMFGLTFLTQSCSYDKCHETLKYQVYVPVVLTNTQLREVTFDNPRPLKNPGKIYVYGKYLFINELYEGVHIYDNSDIANPVNLSFISILGNVDIAVKEDVLYADNYIDLLSFDISDPSNPKFLNSVENVFNSWDKGRERHVVYYKPTEKFEEIDCSNENYGNQWINTDRGYVLFSSDGTNKSGYNEAGSSGASGNVGKGGSMARFTILKNRLYIVDKADLNVINVENAQSATYVGKVKIGWGIETIYPFKDKLFIGSNNGMYVYSTKDEDNPQMLSNFRHARACDPVFVVGDIAYVTLRSGTRCQGYENQLDVIDIKNIKTPKLIKSYSMDNPHGLSVLNNKMVLCEGDYGLKILDIKDSKKIKTKSTIRDKHFYDVIGLSENHILLIGANGLFQYELDGYNLNELGSIPIEK